VDETVKPDMPEVPPAIDSLAGWQAALRWGFGNAQAQGARTITCVDPSFENWPLDDPGVLQGLVAFLRLPGRRLVLLAASYGAVPRQLPRFATWRREWSHAMQTLLVPDEFAAELPSVLIDDRQTSVRLIDPVHWHGRAQVDGRARWLLQEQVDVVLQRSEPGFPVTTLGL
jgi:hypothetical protein